MQPAAAHLASVAPRRTRRRRGGRRWPAPTRAWAGLGGSAAMDRPAARMLRPDSGREARSAGRSTSHDSRVDRTTRTRTAQPARLGLVAGEGAGAVGEGEAACRSGTQTTLVPSSWRSGTRVTPSKSATQARSRAWGRSAWATITWSKPSPARWSTPSVDRTVEPPPGSPDDEGTDGRVPRSPPRRRRTRPRPAAAPPPRTTLVAMERASRPARRASRAGARRSLAWAKALTGTSTGGPRRRSDGTHRDGAGQV